jgi:WD40 repeat protein
VRLVEVDPDGSRMVSGGCHGPPMGHGDAAICEPLCRHEGTVWSLTATADGSRIVSGGEDATVRV